MNISDLIVSQRIGIYYKNRWWAVDLFKTIVSELPDEIVKCGFVV